MASPQSLLLPILAILILLFSLAHCDSVHDILRLNGLPAGLFPKQVKSFTIDELGRLEVFLYGPCLAKFENRMFFDSVVKGNLTYGQLRGLQGLEQEELFIWLPVKDIIVDDPASGLILFDVGVVHKQFSLALFEDPPDCKPEGKRLVSARSVVSVKKEKGLGFAVE